MDKRYIINQVDLDQLDAEKNQKIAKLLRLVLLQQPSDYWTFVVDSRDNMTFKLVISFIDATSRRDSIEVHFVTGINGSKIKDCVDGKIPYRGHGDPWKVVCPLTIFSVHTLTSYYCSLDIYDKYFKEIGNFLLLKQREIVEKEEQERDKIETLDQAENELIDFLGACGRA